MPRSLGDVLEISETDRLLGVCSTRLLGGSSLTTFLSQCVHHVLLKENMFERREETNPETGVGEILLVEIVRLVDAHILGIAKIERIDDHVINGEETIRDKISKDGYNQNRHQRRLHSFVIL